MSDIYFGNTPEPEPIDIDGEKYWRMYTDLPGTSVQDACGHEELDLSCANFEQPKPIGPGCDPVTDRYVCRRKQSTPEQQKPYQSTIQQPIKPQQAQQEPPSKQEPEKTKDPKSKQRSVKSSTKKNDDKKKKK